MPGSTTSFSGSYYRTGSAETFSYNALTRDAPATHYVTMRVGANRDGLGRLGLCQQPARFEDVALSIPGHQCLTGAQGSDLRPITVGLTAEYKF
ncbi:MAG: hypothetical protein WDN69_16060 [Aliidongia sp.]